MKEQFRIGDWIYPKGTKGNTAVRLIDIKEGNIGIIDGNWKIDLTKMKKHKSSPNDSYFNI